MMIEQWKYLPEGILMDILTWLPVKSVLRFRCVSRKWCNHFTNPDFIKLHANHSTHCSLILTKQDPNKFYSGIQSEPYSASCPCLDHNISGDDVTFDLSIEYRCPFHYWKCYIHIIGIYNGLICLRSDPKLLCIWNPVTNEYKKLPEIPDLPPQIAGLVPVFVNTPTYGFGFDCKTGDYKVVKILTPGRGKGSKVWIYTSGTDSWRVLEDIYYVVYLSGENGVFLNGVLHWMVQPSDRPIRVILSFGVGNEKFGELQLPMPLSGEPEGKNYYKSSIGLLDGKLCLSWYIRDGNVDVWVMKNYGVIESWTKLFSVSRLKEDIEYLRPVQSLKNGDILLFGRPLNQLSRYNGDLIFYNPNSGNARFLDTSGYKKLDDARAYVGSLVSVKSIFTAGQEDVEQAMSQ
ncbi:F-box/kelch-repeat protein At3g06240-like [Papaver somniferum]|uniref:F-box/kelch-repeat protein At3g06240-like n=1 Tax=Papaver somniferum TaxID=3469 RepID=UPI000E6FDDA1|nr:F-box/kelch-repeat protein At3g06240-like [Papaver somniferum]